jgi:hypothetical protein
MPQNPTAVNIAVKSGVSKPVLLDSVNNLKTTRAGTTNALGQSASATLKTGAGRAARVAVITAGTTVGGLYDSTSITGNAATAQLAVIPNTVGIYEIDMPFTSGLALVIGTGQVVSVNFD